MGIIIFISLIFNFINKILSVEIDVYLIKSWDQKVLENLRILIQCFIYYYLDNVTNFFSSLLSHSLGIFKSFFSKTFQGDYLCKKV